MPQTDRRDEIWDRIAGPWDILVIGGGIVGAGILREAAQEGLRALLVETHDFASGTSSRSSKMVHGGLRYLNTGQVMLTLQSVRERQRLLREGRGLVDPLKILLLSFRDDFPPGWVIGAGLTVYDILAGKWQHVRKSPTAVQRLCPCADCRLLACGYRFFDAQTDDARLVLRVIREGVRAGGAALNYTRAYGLLRDRGGQVCGAQILDMIGDRTANVLAEVVVNATGAWADELRGQIGRRPRLRRLRGSHLFFPREKLPLDRQITFQHPKDRRYILAFPWEGVTLVGNTDIDCRDPMETDPRISEPETEYLMAAVGRAFGGLGLSPDDVRSTQTGVRSVLDTGRADPSKEPRDEILMDEDGLVTITGGKLTTFRHMARKTLGFVRRRLPESPRPQRRLRALDKPEKEEFIGLAGEAGLSPGLQVRLLGRHGHDAAEVLRGAAAGELSPVGDSPTLWAELRWAAQSEDVIHLDDLLLRRTRLGLLLPEGADGEMIRIRDLCKPILGWDDMRWNVELQSYRALWRRSYSLREQR
ncbi:MAG: glycerol-3-phosphate dehydrogenase/oxidase [Anaerolineales bacterium]|nr:glycerol-3-phosphate dehydrogenase/oxidase [Anaerolineales bacterium]